jgi:hypothetical protein
MISRVDPRELTGQARIDYYSQKSRQYIERLSASPFVTQDQVLRARRYVANADESRKYEGELDGLERKAKASRPRIFLR